MTPHVQDHSRSHACVVHLCGGPYVTYGQQRVSIPQGSQRLVAFVALSRGRIERPYAAGSLWPLGDDRHAVANLRSALWRLRRAGVDVIVADKWSLALAEHVDVDVHQVSRWASRLIQGTASVDDLSLDALPPDALDLLPGWHDDWAIIERERIRQRTLHAMESLSRQLTGLQRHVEAIDVAMNTVAVEPLRESAQRVLIEAHLARGDSDQAGRAFASYRELVQDELNVPPSPDISAMVASARRSHIDRRHHRSTVIVRRRRTSSVANARSSRAGSAP